LMKAKRWILNLLLLLLLSSTRITFASMDAMTASSFRIVFSDVDGTLVHYDHVPDAEDATTRTGDSTSADQGTAATSTILHLPPSSTGMRGVISARTLQLCRRLRNNHGTKLVLVSGMRTSTLIKRLPFLPRADAYASEAGSRIFYPVGLEDKKEEDGSSLQGVIITPQNYDGASDSDLMPFGIKEDTEWRAVMEAPEAAGKDGYSEDEQSLDTLSDRDGALWEFARILQSRGFAIDHKGYAACFRVNRKQQTTEETKGSAFDALLRSSTPDGLSCSVNLGCIDFYPKSSGKKNCCAYLARKFAMEGGSETDKPGDELLGECAVCMCDDDNDLEMALACSRAYLPSVTSSSMADAAKAHLGQIVVTQNEEEGIVGVYATEEALNRILSAF